MHLFFALPVLRLGIPLLVWLSSLSVTHVYAAWETLLPSEEKATPIEEWVPAEGDALIVDTEKNVGYLVHADRGFTSFPLVTGQRRYVRYIGRSYNATTPVRNWQATSVDIKWDRTTFGERGIFLRLSYKDEETPYGIHSHKYVDVMMDRFERYGSMGCIIVTDEMLDIILDTYELNGEALAVRTVYGLGEDVIPNFAVLSEMLQKNS